MIYRRKLYVAVLILLLAITCIAYTFLSNSGHKEYKGTFVNAYSQEAVL